MSGGVSRNSVGFITPPTDCHCGFSKDGCTRCTVFSSDASRFPSRIHQLRTYRSCTRYPTNTKSQSVILAFRNPHAVFNRRYCVFFYNHKASCKTFLPSNLEFDMRDAAGRRSLYFMMTLRPSSERINCCPSLALFDVRINHPV